MRKLCNFASPKNTMDAVLLVLAVPAIAIIGFYFVVLTLGGIFVSVIITIYYCTAEVLRRLHDLFARESDIL